VLVPGTVSAGDPVRVLPLDEEVAR